MNLCSCGAMATDTYGDVHVCGRPACRLVLASKGPTATPDDFILRLRSASSLSLFDWCRRVEMDPQSDYARQQFAAFKAAVATLSRYQGRELAALLGVAEKVTVHQ